MASTENETLPRDRQGLENERNQPARAEEALPILSEQTDGDGLGPPEDELDALFATDTTPTAGRHDASHDRGRDLESRSSPTQHDQFQDEMEVLGHLDDMW